MKPQKTQDCFDNSGGKEKSWRHNSLRLQRIIQSSSAQRSVDQDREPPNVLTSCPSMTEGTRIYNAEKTVSSTNGIGKVGQLHGH